MQVAEILHVLAIACFITVASLFFDYNVTTQDETSNFQLPNIKLYSIFFRLIISNLKGKRMCILISHDIDVRTVSYILNIREINVLFSWQNNMNDSFFFIIVITGKVVINTFFPY
jgi:hypothetical protein